jgi:3-hydroxy-9,10-secoandrosta-1,3,5(10)-triene-9,17-dione monooxygenase reductase component
MQGEPILDSSDFRRVLGHLPTGVTVITAHGDRAPVGMAANSVVSVSLDPPLLLVCPARTSATWPTIREGKQFCVNVMASSHLPMITRFARKNIERFDGVSYIWRPAGPGLEEALAWIDCKVRDEHEAGDHTIVVADVMAIEASARNDDPLVFFRGHYGSFDPGRTEATRTL